MRTLSARDRGRERLLALRCLTNTLQHILRIILNPAVTDGSLGGLTAACNANPWAILSFGVGFMVTSNMLEEEIAKVQRLVRTDAYQMSIAMKPLGARSSA